MTLAVAALCIISARGQGFLNLNFESAYNLPPNPGHGAAASVTNGLPDWIAYDASYALPEISYVSNNLATTTAVALEDGSLALSGDFSVGLYLNGSISQTGLVPGSAKSLQFEAQGPGDGGSLGASSFEVILGGQPLSLSALSTGPDYTVYAANIPASMIGQIEPLIFGCEGVGSGGVVLDNISFSPTAAPEPSVYALLGLGAMLFGLCHLRKVKSA